MQIATITEIHVLRAQARRAAQLPVPIRLWLALSKHWQLAEDRRVARIIRCIEHQGVIADFEAARQRD